MATFPGSNPARSLMRNYLPKLMAGLLVLALLAGCTGGAPSATKDNPADAKSVSDAPTKHIETFYVETERGPYFCIYAEHADGYSGYSGLSCNPVNSTEVGA